MQEIIKRLDITTHDSNTSIMKKYLEILETKKKKEKHRLDNFNKQNQSRIQYYTKTNNIFNDLKKKIGNIDIDKHLNDLVKNIENITGYIDFSNNTNLIYDTYIIDHDFNGYKLKKKNIYSR